MKATKRHVCEILAEDFLKPFSYIAIRYVASIKTGLPRQQKKYTFPNKRDYCKNLFEISTVAVTRDCSNKNS